MADWRFNLKRLGSFIRTVTSSKMALAGIMILVVYGALAIGAPLWSPYDPQKDVVAGSLAPPGWYSYFSEGSRLTKNLQLDPTTGFSSDPFAQGWKFSGDQGLSSSFSPSVTLTPASGSVQISLTQSSMGSSSGIFEKTFDWAFESPPNRLAGSIAINTPDASPTHPVSAQVFIERISDHRIFPLTNNASWANPPISPYPFVNASWHVPITQIDSRTSCVAQVNTCNSLQTVLNTNVDPAALILSSSGQYVYGVKITLTGTGNSTQRVFLDNMNLRLYGTSWGLLGTDYTGFDVWSQLIYGARISLVVGLLSAVIGVVMGLVVGLIAGYLGRIVDEVLMRFTDMLLVIPTLPLLIVLVAVIGNSLGTSRLPILILVIGFLGWMGFARVVRAQVLTLKERPFVEAAKAAGAGNGHITIRHIVPNIVGLIYVNLALAVPGAILSEAALSFLGLGDVTVMSWGRMLNLVQTYSAQKAWWWVLPPGISIALVSLAFVMIGFSLDALFNPKLRSRR